MKKTAYYVLMFLLLFIALCWHHGVDAAGRAGSGGMHVLLQLMPLLLAVTAGIMIGARFFAPAQISELTDKIAERKKTAGDLEVSEKKFKTIFDNTFDGIVITDPVSRKFNDANISLCRMLGYSLGELTMLGVADIHPKEALPYVLAQMDKQSHGLSAPAEDIPVQRKDGSIFYASILGTRINLSGKDYMVAIFRDITEKKYEQEKLGFVRAKLELALTSAMMGVWEFNIAENKRIFDDQTCLLLGIDPFAFRGSAEEFFAAVHPDDRQELKAALEKTVTQKAPYEIEYRVVWPDGSIHRIATRGKLLNDENGNSKMINGIVWDITESKKTETDLRASRQIIEGIINSIPVRVFWKDKNLVYLGCNTIFAHDAGFSDPKDIIGKDDYQMGWKDQAGLYRKDDLQVISSGISKLLIEEPQTTPKGEAITLLTSKLPLRDLQGDIIGIIGTYMDITERKQNEQELKAAYSELQETQRELIQSSKMSAMGQLAAGVSHELNQPLTGIRGFAQAMLMDIDAANPLRPDLEKIIEQADRMDKIIKNVRFFARKSEFKMEGLDINKPIQDGCMLLREQLKVYTIGLELLLAPELPAVQGDLNQLQQVVINLITNARDAIESAQKKEGGLITIATRLLPEKQAIELTVADNGVGIPDESLEHIFTPFFTTKSPNGGMGLGLAIVYRIVENHRGTVRVESAYQAGTKFIIILPCMARPA